MGVTAALRLMSLGFSLHCQMCLCLIHVHQITMTSLSLCFFIRFLLQPTTWFSSRKPEALWSEKCRLIAYTETVSIISSPLALHRNSVLHKWYARTYQFRCFNKQASPKLRLQFTLIGRWVASTLLPQLYEPKFQSASSHLPPLESMRKLPQTASINLMPSLGVTAAYKIHHQFYLLLPPPINMPVMNQKSKEIMIWRCICHPWSAWAHLADLNAWVLPSSFTAPFETTQSFQLGQLSKKEEGHSAVKCSSKHLKIHNSAQKTQKHCSGGASWLWVEIYLVNFTLAIKSLQKERLKENPLFIQ